MYVVMMFYLDTMKLLVKIVYEFTVILLIKYSLKRWQPYDVLLNSPKLSL